MDYIMIARARFGNLRYWMAE